MHQVEDVLVLGHYMPLVDAGPADDPVMARVNAFFQVGIRQTGLGNGGSGADDTSAHAQSLSVS